VIGVGIGVTKLVFQHGGLTAVEALHVVEQIEDIFKPFVFFRRTFFELGFKLLGGGCFPVRAGQILHVQGEDVQFGLAFITKLLLFGDHVHDEIDVEM